MEDRFHPGHRHLPLPSKRQPRSRGGFAVPPFAVIWLILVLIAAVALVPFSTDHEARVTAQNERKEQRNQVFGGIDRRSPLSCPDWSRYRGEFPPLIRQATPRTRVEPRYTEAARRAGIEGTVVLQVGIRKDGTVGGACVLKALPLGLDASAIEAVQRWRFIPPLLDGAPADVIANVKVEFRLEGGQK